MTTAKTIKTFYTADLHSHSRFSDGKDTPLEMYRSAQDQGLDFFALTDHNTVAGVEELLAQLSDEDRAKTEVVPGFELSLLSGHWLILDIPLPNLKKQINKWGLSEGSVAAQVKRPKALDMFRWVQDQGGLVIAAHPGLFGGIMSASTDFVGKLFSEKLVHGMEVHNNDLQRKLSLYYRYWHGMVTKFAAARSIPAYANSDAHRFQRLASHHNQFTVPQKHNLLDALKKGLAQIEHKQK